MRNLTDRLADIIEAIEKIETATAKGKDAFDSDPLIQVWMVHHIMIIGEAIQRLDPEFKQKHPQIPWREITKMRNVIVHDYFRIDAKVVWDTVQRDIPELKIKLLELLSRFDLPSR
jgi:uncharacterized protein with HEPN domain